MLKTFNVWRIVSEYFYFYCYHFISLYREIATVATGRLAMTRKWEAGHNAPTSHEIPILRFALCILHFVRQHTKPQFGS